jgi:hypothetical protein
VSRVTDLSAVVVSARHRNHPDREECCDRYRVKRRKTRRSPKSRNSRNRKG